MNKNKRIIRLGLGVATIVMLTPTLVMAQVADHKIEVTVKNNAVVISQNNSIKAVNSKKLLQWDADAKLGKIEIKFVQSKGSSCTSSLPDIEAEGPCLNVQGNSSRVISCRLKDKLGPCPSAGCPVPPAPALVPDFHDYCYGIRGWHPDGWGFESLDPVVRGRR